MNNHRRIGTWDLSEVAAERNGVYNFLIRAPGMTFTFQPLDPSGFSEAIGAVIELRTSPKTRFGLAERVRQAQQQA